MQIKLFTVENGIVMPTEDTLTTYPFSLMWQRDETAHKERARNDFAFIHKMTYPDREENPFYGYDEEIRSIKILENIRMTVPNYSIDNIVLEGINQRNKFFEDTIPSLSLLNGARIQAKRLETWLREFNINELQGNPLKLKPKDVTNALKDIDDVATKLDTLETKIKENLFVVSKSKAGRKINPLER